MATPGEQLDGVRIIDLTRLLPGPLCTQHLADLGAEVVKIEDTTGGDYGRYGLGVGSEHDAVYFDLVNRGKRSVALDLKRGEGREVFLRLATGAQVLIEGFRPGVMERLGLGYQKLRECNPGIVYCSLTGYGQTGPLHAQAGHDINYCALTGLTEQTGHPGGEPVISAFQIADLAGGTLTATTAILAALYKAQRTGQGAHLDVAMTDGVMAHAVFSLAMHRSAGGVAPRGGGVLNGGSPCYGIYRTADDRFIAVGALEPKFWRRLCEALERPDLVEKHSASDGEEVGVRGELERIFHTRTRDEWVEVLAEADCCVSPVLTFDEALEHPQFVSRGVVLRDASPLSGVTGFGFPVRIDGSGCASDASPPGYGEHTGDYLRECGYGDSEIARLAETGVVYLDCPASDP